MTAFNVRIAPNAEDDITTAFQWYLERRRTVADDFRQEVINAIERAAASPLMRKADARGDRRIVLRRFPYTVWYFVEEGTVTVVAVAHQRRRPLYWHEPPA